MTRIVGKIAIIFLIVAFFVFVSKFKKNDKSYKIFTIYLGIISLCEVSSWISLSFLKNNLIIGHVDSVSQFVLVSYFFYSMAVEHFHRKLILYLSLLVTIFICGHYIFDPALLFKYNKVETFATAMVLIIYAVIHLYNLLNQHRKFYYITIGLLIYLVGSTVIVLTGNILIALQGSGLFKKIWIFNNLFYLSFQIFVLYEWFTNYYKKQLKL